MRGATGPTGATGAVGTILGSYDTIAQLIAAHPTGTQGEAYLVGGELYVWNTDTNQWESVGDLQGATGAVGTILGSYDTIAQLIAAHPTGTQGDAYLVDGELYVWNTDANQWESVGDLQGATGAVGTILGSYDTIDELIAEHPTGAQGDAYLVDGKLDVWNTETNQWEEVGTLEGPAGAVGTILGSFETLAQLMAAHPTGAQGDAYLVGSELYVWNTESDQWQIVGSLQGPTGPTGPAGENGVVGEISGVVATVDDLPDTGIEPGTIYYVEADESIYYYDGEEDWIRLGMIQGPQGATGPTGPAGADGTIGEISGVAVNAEALPDTGVEQGTMYYVEQDGSVYLWDEESGWTRLNVAQGPRGVTGATGATGAVGTILGSYDSLADLQAAHPTGNQGDAYLVNGVLYVWDVDNNAWRAVGNLGPAAEAVTIIPFASQVAPRTYINGGVPARVSLIGFGYGDTRNEIADTYSFAVNSDNTFVLEGANDNLQLVFSLPFDMIIRSIALTTGNWGEYLGGLAGTVYPFVQLFAAPPTSNTFLPLVGGMAIPETGHGPGNVPANTMLSALTENLDIRLRAGTRIAIGAQARIDGDTEARDYYLYFTGGIGMTRWVE